ncbi:MAG: DUF4450 domain-containing protein [Armatimonadetes bacterium]|nr:DUF4450 domain-containing protein [Armatimonadota bacterium]
MKQTEPLVRVLLEAILFALILCPAAISANKPNISNIKIERIPIELRRDKPRPTVVPEVNGVLFDGNFMRDYPSHPALQPGDKAYTPIREGGFSMENGTRYFNRPIFRMGNMISTGDRPMFLIHRSFWSEWCSKLRFSLSRGERAKWLDEFQSVYAEFWPGSTRYVCSDAELDLKVKLTAAAADKGWTSLFEIEVSGRGAKDARIHWVFGDIENHRDQKSNRDSLDQFSLPDYWLPELKMNEEQTNESAEVEPGVFRVMVDVGKHENWQKLPNCGIRNIEMYAGSEWPGQKIGPVGASAVSTPLIRVLPGQTGRLIACEVPVKDGWKGTMAVVWGGRPNDFSGHEQAMRRLNIPWGMELYKEWYENYVGRGSQPLETFKQVMASPEKAMSDALEFWSRIRNRVVVETPDDEVTAWANWLTGSQEYLHWLVGQIDGIDAWGLAYLHIAHMYDGWDYCGVHEQQEKWLRIFASSVRKGWIGLYHGTAPWFATEERPNTGAENQITHYLNCVYSHWLWTGDDRFFHDIWHFIKPLMERQLMQNDPDGDGLFAARHPDWAPEDDSFGPKSQTETAQSLRALKGCIELARVAGDNDAERKYAAYVARIESALPGLWDSDKGILGYRGPDDVLRTNSGAAQVFFPILRSAVDRVQGYQMLTYTRNTLWAEDKQYPGVARIIVCPHHVGRTGLGPLTDMSWRMFAAAGLVGDTDRFWPVFKTMVHSYFFSSWPGGECAGVTACGSGHAGMNDHNDGRMPALYALGRGLFGLEPDVPHGKITIEPRFPSDWKKASISQPSISYSYEVKGDSVQMQVKTPKQLAKTLRIPVRRDVSGVKIDGKQATFTVEPGINRAYVVVDLPLGTRNTVVVKLKGREIRLAYPAEVVIGRTFKASVSGAERVEMLDPQSALTIARRERTALDLTPVRTGRRTAFIIATRGLTSCYLPMDFDVEEQFAIASPAFDAAAGMLSFELKNSSGEDGIVKAKVKIAGRAYEMSASLVSGEAKVEVSLDKPAISDITPGSNPITVEIDGKTYINKFVNWDACGDTSQELVDRAVCLDFAWEMNEESADVFNNKFFYDAWINGIDYPIAPSKTYEYANHSMGNPKLDLPRFLAAGRIPFYVVDEKSLGGAYQTMIGGGPRNVLALANWRPWLYPSNILIPVKGMKLCKIYFLACSWYRAHQAHHPCAELLANYSDGTSALRQLIPPFSFNPLYGRKSINMNGYDVEIIASGLPTGAYLKTDVVDFPLDPTKSLESIEVRSVVSESIFAIFGITLVKAK